MSRLGPTVADREHSSEPADMKELLQVLRLASPSLPVGAFAYSQGLETAVEMGWISDAASAKSWIGGLLSRSLGLLDVPILARLWSAWDEDDTGTFSRVEASLLAARESSELQAEELQLGSSLSRLTLDLRVAPTDALRERPRTYLGAFAAAAVEASMSEVATLCAYCYAWLEHQTSAVTRLVPLGQTEAQAILSACLAAVPEVVQAGRAIPDADIGASNPGLAIASALHESQYTRIFRS